MFKKILLAVIIILSFCGTNAYAAPLPPVAAQIMAPKQRLMEYWEGLPPVARYILFDLPNEQPEELTLEFESGDEVVRTESDWDQLPYAPPPTDDITEFFRAMQPKDHIPQILTPRDGSLLPDNSNIHIRVKYDGDEPLYAEINSLASSSRLEIKDKELVILSSKLVRNREYHLRVRAGKAFSQTVSFSVGSKYEDEIARIIANTDIVTAGPRIPMEKIFPNGFFHSEEEADANMVTITVKVWRANAEEVEVAEEEVVDEIVRTIKVPVSKYNGENVDTEVSEDILFDRSVGKPKSDDDSPDEDEAAEEAAETDGTEAEKTDDTAEPDAGDGETDTAAEALPAADAPDEPQDTDTADSESESAEGPGKAENDDSAEKVDTDDIIEEITVSEKPAEDVTNELGELVIEDYTEITTVEYVTKTVHRMVNKGELYSSTASFTCNRALADTFRKVFDELYAIKFPINDIGCYSWRNTAGGRISEHALGTAVDINYMQNYCIYGDGSTVGDYWRPYEDIYSVTPEVVNIFRRHNFSWGGSWVTPKDYMHFSYFGT